jgi:hypothetical protein
MTMMMTMMTTTMMMMIGSWDGGDDVSPLRLIPLEYMDQAPVSFLSVGYGWMGIEGKIHVIPSPLLKEDGAQPLDGTCGEPMGAFTCSFAW